MALTRGTRLGPYEVIAQIGVGGMGEVYRATDTSLKRQVAIKVLPASLADDPSRLARLQREAELLAALNHPNIAAIYGLERSAGTCALVMELVDGSTLADRIALGAIPIDEALAIAKQIAAALEGAHEQGIIHRDLKPANIIVRPDGTVKVLDFGLAKAIVPPVELTAGSVAQTPTVSAPAMVTDAGTILGTAAYMSPEQSRGQAVDKRSDVWAFGAVLFEMLTAKRAFGGHGMSETLANVLTSEPMWDALPVGLSPTLVVYVQRCLHKDWKQRLGDMHDMRLALEGAFETAASPATSTTILPVSRARLAWAGAGIVGVALIAAILAVAPWRSSPAFPETRADLVTPHTDQPGAFALSPDGQQVVFVASGDGPSRLWHRSLATTTAQPLAGTEGAAAPFWSPDSRSVGFIASGVLKRLDLGGGAPQTLAPALASRGGSWNTDGVILFAPYTVGPLMRIPATGGTAAAATALGPQQNGHSGPYFLPGGRQFLFYILGGPDTAGIYLGALDGSTPTRLTPADGTGVYLPEGPTSGALPAAFWPTSMSRTGGWLLWTRAGILVAQRLNLVDGTLAGEPITLSDRVVGVSVSSTGLVAYRTGAEGQRQLTWVDRSGTVLGTVGAPDNSYHIPRVSPDGRRVVVSRTIQGNSDLWLMDGVRMSKVTFDDASDGFPVWSPDGARIAFRSTRTGSGEIYLKMAGGAGQEDRLIASADSVAPTSWTKDGSFLLYNSNPAQAATDIWVVPMADNRTPSIFLKTPFREIWGAFSPDGRWVAYMSNESGRMEVYVRPFVPPGGRPGTAAVAPESRWPVSTTGGIMPAWRRDGRELYYLDPSGAMMATPITITGTTVEPGVPVALFPSQILGGGEDAGLGPQYDVASDGRFLINRVVDHAAAPITLLTNWNAAKK